MEENKNALDEINKGCSMGIEAINKLIDKIKSEKFRHNLLKELKLYRNISDQIHAVYDNYAKKEPHEISELTKAMTDYMMNIKTMKDQSDSKIAEILMQGTNMGIIEGRRILNNKKLNEEVNDIIDEFVGVQEKEIEMLKKYL